MDFALFNTLCSLWHAFPGCRIAVETRGMASSNAFRRFVVTDLTPSIYSSVRKKEEMREYSGDWYASQKNDAHIKHAGDVNFDQYTSLNIGCFPVITLMMSLL